MRSQITESRLAALGAGAIARGFDRYQTQFRAITQRAASRFEQHDWPAAQADARERLDLYSRVVARCKREIGELLGDRVDDRTIWPTIKAAYSALITERDGWELAETFFNSITRQIFTTVGVDPAIEFVATDFAKPPTKAHKSVHHSYDRGASTAATIEAILTDFRFRVLYEDIRRDAKLVAVEIESHLRRHELSLDFDRIEVVRSAFFRGRGAYLIGRILIGRTVVPLVLALRSHSARIVVDAVLLDENDVSILFSFTRSYFHVDHSRPYDLVRFLHSLAPRKRINEIYTAIGHHKHGKTELYRDLLDHLDTTDDRFELAPGTAGLVMAVFTLPAYGVVFKVMRDVFGTPKQVTRNTVMDKYRLVFRHDRVGRLIDAQEFEHLQFDRSRFEPSLLEQLASECSRLIEVNGDQVVIKHAYVERQVTPLNLYIRQAEEPDAVNAVIDFGRAIKDLAASNIFPGDMLLKNFGVTRHRRIVFYDYDELAEMTSCVFKEMPEADHFDDEMSAEPWFGVADNDIFPAEFRSFLGMPRALREVFEATHGDLFEVEYWHTIQEQLRAGEMIEIFPYGQTRRLQQE